MFSEQETGPTIAQMLAESEAKRQIVALGSAENEGALRVMAAVYASHPDYNESWRT